MISSTFIYTIHCIAEGQYGFLATTGKSRCDTQVWLCIASTVMTTHWISGNSAVLGVWLCTSLYGAFLSWGPLLLMLEFQSDQSCDCIAKGLRCGKRNSSCKVWSGRVHIHTSTQKLTVESDLSRFKQGNCFKLFQPTSEHNHRNRALINPGTSTMVASSGLRLFQ